MSPATSDIRLQFEFPGTSGERNLLSFAYPERVIVAHSVEEVRPGFEEVERAVSEGKYVAGYLAYEAAAAFDPAMVVAEADKRFPPLWFGVFDSPSSAPLPHIGGTYEVSSWQPDIAKSRYIADIARIKEAIAAGETYQVNYTLRLNAPFSGDPFSFYEQMKRSQRGRYNAFLDIGRYQILSASPELFFSVDEGTLCTKPMKGTIRRGRWLEEDEALKATLQNSEKNRAENVMIVDLLRNDLGRVSEVGSVRVEDLFAVETYETLSTMTSTIKAQLKPDVPFADLFGALFPCGSVTGAPKIHTMKLIAQLENRPRHVYCGAIGYITPRRNAMFNVPIRTVLLDSKTQNAEYGVGGGVVWDSDTDDEFDEAMLKASFLSAARPSFELLETLRFENDQYALLDRHMARLMKSAAYFGIDISEPKVRQVLVSEGGKYQGEARRVRLLVDRAGHARVSSTPLGEVKARIHACLAETPVNTEDIFLYHKTTQRAQYRAQLERAQQSQQVDDVLLWNEVGELTEFSVGNVVVELNGVKWTPPRACGLLQGTFAEELLANEQIRPKRLHKSCLSAASRIWLINSVRGWVEVNLSLSNMPKA